MKLDEWRKANGLSYRQVAERLRAPQRGFTPSPEAVRRWSLPEEHPLARMPDRCTLRWIRTVTLGAVTADDFIYD